MRKFVNKIEGFENVEGYEICSNGDVYSYKSGVPKKLNPYKNTKGYLLVDLGVKRRAIKVHRLVALAFIPNFNNYPQVNHIDGDKRNNNYKNLEWVNNSMNQIHAFKLGLNKSKKGDECYNYNKEHFTCKRVCRIDNDGNTKEYVSLAQAARDNNIPSYSSISTACKRRGKSHGFRWEFID